MLDFTPLQFGPILKRKCWGGSALRQKLKKSTEPGDDYGESWELVDFPEDQSVVVKGTYTGMSLQDLVRLEPNWLLGSPHKFHRFPMLIKWIDATSRLSLQVHPSDDQATKWKLGETGKSEAWVILECQPDAVLYAGFSRHCNAKSVTEMLQSETIESYLNAISVSPGDCFFVPAGVVHAIGAGILLAEVQQPSNITFRLHDWNRKDRRGQLRPLQIEQALRIARFDQQSIVKSVPILHQCSFGTVELLLEEPAFCLRRYTLKSNADSVAQFETEGKFRVLICFAGAGECGSEQGRGVTIRLGETLLIPAGLEHYSVIRKSTETLRLLEVSHP